MPKAKVEKPIVKKPVAKKEPAGLSVPAYFITGKTAGTLSLPKEIFGGKVNQTLLSQAMRVYLSNQKSLTAFTKTRGEVQGSTAKIWRQKGTGRARHGSVRAPIFVGGGIVFGPKPRKVVLTLPQKMKKAALYSAFASKVADKEIMGISGVDKATGKTKEVADFLTKLNIKSALIVIAEKEVNMVRGARNIPGVTVMPVSLINALEVLKHNMLFLTKEAVEKFK